MTLLDLGVGAVDLFIYFQDYTGKIRSSELKGNAWLQGQPPTLWWDRMSRMGLQSPPYLTPRI